mmetsp:Transcript_40868/g.45660  ORF Transcript_40868/g.45660 Transcript_40868/m.45660 type:complete len:86 (-) Transcript_40868:358-615(-)
MNSLGVSLRSSLARPPFGYVYCNAGDVVDDADDDDGTLLTSRCSLFFMAKESLTVLEVSSLDTSNKPEFELDYKHIVRLHESRKI